MPSPAVEAVALFAAEVGDYLQRTPRQLPSKYLYDPLGSALFDAICLLPWYRITRAESALLAKDGEEIFRPFEAPVTVTELGCGNGEKLALVLEALGSRCRQVQLVDISSAALEHARERIDTFPLDSILLHKGTYEEGLQRAAAVRQDGPMVVLFLGSNIGNFDPPAAHDLLVRIRSALREGDGLVLGSDLVKPRDGLLLAYDDPLQVTAAFNRNLLRRINDDLGGTFDLDGFAHRAVWNAPESRVEMHLVSRRRQAVEIPAAGLDVLFEPGEWIWTESSYKYEPRQVLVQGQAAGFGTARQWIDPVSRFALTRFQV